MTDFNRPTVILITDNVLITTPDTNMVKMHIVDEPVKNLLMRVYGVVNRDIKLTEEELEEVPVDDLIDTFYEAHGYKKENIPYSMRNYLSNNPTVRVGSF